MSSRARKNTDGKGPHRVEFQVIQLVYFDPERVLSGPEFAGAWSRMGQFGNKRVLGGFWHANELPPKHPPRFPIGSDEQLAPLLAQGDKPIFGGGFYAPRNVARNDNVDKDFSFEVGGSCSCFDGGEELPYLMFSLSDEWFGKAGGDVVVATIREHFELVDRHAPPYGFVNVAFADDVYGGLAYASVWFQNIPLHRWVEQRNWLHTISRRQDMARSIYWGNYFGPKILDRLGGRERFLKRFRKETEFKDGSTSAIVWEFTNGVFVSLCLDPLGCRPGKPLDFAADFNMDWLHTELAKKGVLCGWCDDA